MAKLARRSRSCSDHRIDSTRLDAFASSPVVAAIAPQVPACSRVAGATPAAQGAGWYARNNPWVSAAVDSLVGNVVCAGIKPQSTHPDRAVREPLHVLWLRSSDHADQGGPHPILARKTHLCYCRDGFRFQVHLTERNQRRSAISRCEKSNEDQHVTSSAPNRRSHQVRRISALRDRFWASWRLGQCSAPPTAANPREQRTEDPAAGRIGRALALAGQSGGGSGSGAPTFSTSQAVDFIIPSSWFESRS